MCFSAVPTRATGSELCGVFGPIVTACGDADLERRSGVAGCRPGGIGERLLCPRMTPGLKLTTKPRVKS
jgi:hypothetical protein